MRRLLLLAIAAIALTACRVDDTHYVFPDDATGNDGVDPLDGGTDAAAHTIVLGSTGVTIREGDTMSESVKLSSPPTGSVMVTTMLPPSSGLTLTPATLTFTDEDWDREQYIFVEAIEDADAVDAQKSIIFSATGYGSVPLPVSIVDNDTLAIFAAPASINVTEGLNGTVQVRLTAQPTSDVTVTISSDTPAAATVAPASLTFTGGPSGNWSALQSVTVTGAQDGDGLDDTAVVSASASGMAGATVDVHVTDDEVLAIVPSSISFGLTEGQVKSDFTVGLTVAPPAGSLIVNVASSDPAITVSPAQLTFTSAAAQPVTVTAVSDDNYADEAVTITLSVAGGMPTPRDVAVAVTDDDQQTILTAPTSAVTVAEGTSTPVDVHLAFRPTSAVVVDVSTLASTHVSVDHATLSFTPADFAINQRVMVTGLSDNDLASDTATLRLSTPDAADRDLAVTIPDDDSQTLITSADTLSFNEGTQTTFTVRLGFVPQGTVPITVASANPTVVPNPTTLTFNFGNYDQPQLVTVSAPSDGDTMDLVTTVTVSGAGAPAKVLPTTVIDTTSQDILVMPTSLTVTEGQMGTLTVKLGASPSTPVTVNVGGYDPAVVTASPSSIVLNASNYNIGVPVTVFGVDDVDLSNESTTIVFSATGLSSKSANVTVIDNDTIRVVVTPRVLPLDEGNTGPVTVTLSATPLVDVTVNISPGPGVSSSRPSIMFPAGMAPANEVVNLTALRDDNVVLNDTNVNFNPSVGMGDTVMVHEANDYTVLVGYPGMAFDPGSEAGGGLEGWAAPVIGQGGPMAMPSCLQIDKAAMIQKTASVSAAVEIGLYTGTGTGSSATPSLVLFDSGMRALTGVGVNVFPAPAATTICPTPQTFIAMQGSGSPMPMFGSTTTSSVAHCQRTGQFWSLPSPFAQSGCSPDSTPLQVWLITHAPIGCMCSPPA